MSVGKELASEAPKQLSEEQLVGKFMLHQADYRGLLLLGGRDLDEARIKRWKETKAELTSLAGQILPRIASGEIERIRVFRIPKEGSFQMGVPEYRAVVDLNVTDVEEAFPQIHELLGR